MIINPRSQSIYSITNGFAILPLMMPPLRLGHFVEFMPLLYIVDIFKKGIIKIVTFTYPVDLSSKLKINCKIKFSVLVQMFHLGQAIPSKDW